MICVELVHRLAQQQHWRASPGSLGVMRALGAQRPLARGGVRVSRFGLRLAPARGYHRSSRRLRALPGQPEPTDFKTSTPGKVDQTWCYWRQLCSSSLAFP
jgi:hypothetical protein